MKLNLYDIISCKTFYYFLKDTSNLDVSGYEEREYNEEDYANLDQDDLVSSFWDVMHGTDDIVEIKTEYGSIIYHNIKNFDYVKEFLKTNSKNAPCALFGSYRTTDVCMFGLAENGELKRFMYTDGDGNTELDGERSYLEEESNLDFKLNEEGEFLTEFVDEDDIINLAQNFIPFDIEKDAVEILSIKTYVKPTQNKEKPKVSEPALITSKLTNDILDDISQNMHKQNITEVGLFFIKCKKDKKIYFISFSKEEDDKELVRIYSTTINSIKNKQEVISSIAECLNVWAKCNFKVHQAKTSDFDDCLNKFKHGDKRTIALFMVSINIYGERAFGEVDIGLYKKKGKSLGKISSILNTKKIRSFKPTELSVVYEFLRTRLK